MGEVAVHVIAVAEIEAAFTAVGSTHRTGEAVEGIVLIVVATATDGIFTAEDVIRTVVVVMEVAVLFQCKFICGRPARHPPYLRKTVNKIATPQSIITPPTKYFISP